MPDSVEQVPEVGWYVYAVLPSSGTPTTSLTGIDDAPVEYVELGELVAATSVMALDRPPGRRRDLLAHSELVDALARSTTVVPVEFGSVMADRQSVIDDLLAPGARYFAELLQRLEGAEQFNLRGTYDEEQVLAEVVHGDPHIAELRRRTRDLPEGTLHPDLVRLGEEVSAALDRKRAEDSDSILNLVVPHVLELRDRPGAGVDRVFDVALLVERARREEVEEALEELAEAVHERVRLSLTGPLPPYDFVQEEAWA
jgi:hypothetical protein